MPGERYNAKPCELSTETPVGISKVNLAILLKKSQRILSVLTTFADEFRIESDRERFLTIPMIFAAHKPVTHGA